ncbi:MAG: cytochrome c family protein [Alphaproteobacteria bacterium]|nr:cytochrome c family protein [Alphaproteobacteria bacterium]
MSGAEINKLILACLTVLLVMLLIGNVVNELSHSEPLERNAYVVIPSDEPAAAAAAEAEPGLESILPLLASADPDAGQKAAKRCAACHTFNDGGANKLGPNLWAIVGKEKGTVDGFSYSDAIEDKGGVWSYDDLNAFLADPKGFLKGTKMNFSGISDAEDRAAVIAYMRQQADSPQPLPE